jgi:hypothetical protein
MTKKLISLFTMVAIVFGTMLTVSAQEESSSYAMWETIMLTPDNKQLKVLGENMRKHNQTYHSEGPHKATVYSITSGPNSGKIVWEMGPLTFGDLDTRPAAGGHDEDWRDNVMPYIKKMGSIEYWKEDSKVSNTSMLDDDHSKYPILHIRYFEVARDHGYSIDHLLKQIGETVKAMDGENPWGVYDNQFRQGYDIGRHIATIGFNKNWAEYDEDGNFKETFLKVHGEDSWDAFIEGMGDSFHNSWDEIWVYDANLSGD